MSVAIATGTGVDLVVEDDRLFIQSKDGKLKLSLGEDPAAVAEAILREVRHLRRWEFEAWVPTEEL